MANREKQQRRTHRKLLAQRNAARTEQDRLAARIEVLNGDIAVVAGEEIRRMKQECDARVSEALRVKLAAEAERDAVLNDFDNAMKQRISQTVADLEQARANLKVAETLLDAAYSDKAIAQNTAQEQIVGLQRLVGTTRSQMQLVREENATLTKELATLKSEDAKALRKRLQSKTERIAELEAQLKNKSATGVHEVHAPQVLSRLLMNKLIGDQRGVSSSEPVPENPPAVSAPEAGVLASK